MWVVVTEKKRAVGTVVWLVEWWAARTAVKMAVEMADSWVVRLECLMADQMARLKAGMMVERLVVMMVGWLGILMVDATVGEMVAMWAVE